MIGIGGLSDWKLDVTCFGTWTAPYDCHTLYSVELRGERRLGLKNKTVLFLFFVFNHVGLVQKQTREVEEAEKVFLRGVRELSEMEQIDKNVCGENWGEQKRGGLGQLIVTIRAIWHRPHVYVQRKVHVDSTTCWWCGQTLLPCCTLVHIYILLLILCPLFIFNLSFFFFVKLRAPEDVTLGGLTDMSEYIVMLYV